MSAAHNFGNKIRAARKAAGMNQSELAKRLGVTQSAVSRMEAGDFEPSATHLARMALIFGVPVSSLMPAEVRETDVGHDDISASVLSDYAAPPGLRDFAADKSLIDAMHVTADELDILRAIPIEGVSKDGYVQLLITLRAIRP